MICTDLSGFHKAVLSDQNKTKLFRKMSKYATALLLDQTYCYFIPIQPIQLYINLCLCSYDFNSAPCWDLLLGAGKFLLLDQV